MEQTPGSASQLSPRRHRPNELTDLKFRLFVESISHYAMFLIDPNGYIQSWNEGATKLQGYSADEVLGKHISIFYTTDDLARNHPQHELSAAMKNDRYEEEGWRVKKDGSKFWANTVITAIRDDDGTLSGFGKVTRDLSEKKQSEEALRLSEVRARRMFEGVRDYAMISLNADGTIATWNNGARQITGYEKGEIIGKHFSIFYTEEDVRMGKCDYEIREVEETGRFEEEGWRVRKDGTKFWASVLLTAIRDDRGNLLGFSKVTRDITDKKRAEDLLKMAYANLEKRVEERTKELSESNARLQIAVKARDEFLSIASHELRTPLTPLRLQIDTFARQVLNKTISNASQDRLERMALTCTRGITRLTSLIDNLLDISRIDTGRLALHFETFDMLAVTKDTLERFKAEVQSSGSEVIFNSTIPVYGTFDRMRVEQIFVNLLTNALRYGDNNPIHISLTTENEHAVLVFRDQGIGIEEKDFERIFKRFERVEGNGVAGMGLGLYITKQIVEAHAGTITVESKLGEGSTFTVRLPIVTSIQHH